MRTPPACLFSFPTPFPLSTQRVLIKTLRGSALTSY